MTATSAGRESPTPASVSAATESAPPPLLAQLRAALRAIRHFPDRLLHARRRRSARRTAAGTSGRIVVMCHGNICRSPYAAEVLRQRLGDAVAGVVSAGFVGDARPSPETAVQAAGMRGVSLEKHRSQIVTRELLASAALVIVMERGQKRRLLRQFGPTVRVLLLGDFDPHPIQTRTVIDPIDRDVAFFSAVYQRIDRCVDELASAIATAPRETG